MRDFPIYIFLSLCNVKQFFYRNSPEGMGWIDNGPLGREIVVALPESMLRVSKSTCP